MMPCSVFLVEDDETSVEQLSRAVTSDPDLRLLGVARTVAEARCQLRRSLPDVLVVDLGLPDGHGLDLIRLARAEGLARQILVLTMFAQHNVVLQCLMNGATGYLLKGDGDESLASQIGHLRRGGRPISPLIARELLDRLMPDCAADLGAVPALSQREQSVLQLCAKGCTYDEVARLLTLSSNTVETYVRRIFRKLQVHNKVEALYEARRLGLTQD